jgi:hypothetical protein
MDSAYGLSEPGMHGNLCIVTLPCSKESFPNCENCAGVSNEAVLGIRFRHGATACHSLPQPATAGTVAFASSRSLSLAATPSHAAISGSV